MDKSKQSVDAWGCSITKFSAYLPGYSWKLIIIDVEKTPDVDAFLTETALFTASTASVATFVANAAGSLTEGGLGTWHGLPKWLSCPYWAKHGAVAKGSAGVIYWPIRSESPTNIEPNKHQTATADPGLVTAHYLRLLSTITFSSLSQRLPHNWTDNLHVYVFIGNWQ